MISSGRVSHPLQLWLFDFGAGGDLGGFGYLLRVYYKGWILARHE